MLIKEKTNRPFWGECLLPLLYLQVFQVSATITEIAEPIIPVLGNTSCTAAHWMWIIFNGVMHYYAGFNYRIIGWSFPQNTDLIYFDSKYLQNWLWHNHEISTELWSVWPEEELVWLKRFTFSGCAKALLYLFFTNLLLPTPLEHVGSKEPLSVPFLEKLSYLWYMKHLLCLLSVSC